MAMTQFNAVLEKFDSQGEKTGWTYIRIPAAIAAKINPGVKKSYRIKGTLDDHPVEKIALLPMGEGDFIMAINASMKKGIGKKKGAAVKVRIELDKAPIESPPELLECLADEPEALRYYNSLPQGHRNYFTKWIDSAKTDPTRTKRIALVVKTMARKMDFGAMLREERDERRKLGR